MQSSNTFYTEPKQRINDHGLGKYADQLTDKVNYATWKQDLVLNFNYMPLKNIKEKIETERKNYEKKMKEEQQKMMKLSDNSDMNQQIELFQNFKDKLENKLKEIQIKIDKERMRIRVLGSEVRDKRERLKELARENMYMTKNIYEQNGITTKKDIIRLMRSQSMRDNLQLTSNKKNSISTATKIDTQRTSNPNSDKLIYKECCDSIINSIKHMKSSQDVQSGIYLDIMSKKEHSKNGRYSMRSTICHTLIDRYGKSNTEKKKKKDEDFEMTWETFRLLNWKQIMGIVLVKDRDGKKLRSLLECGA